MPTSATPKIGARGVLVDRHEERRALDAAHVLERAADADGDVDLRLDGHAGGADLPALRQPALVDDGPRARDLGAEGRRRGTATISRFSSSSIPRPTPTRISACVMSTSPASGSTVRTGRRPGRRRRVRTPRGSRRTRRARAPPHRTRRRAGSPWRRAPTPRRRSARAPCRRRSCAPPRTRRPRPLEREAVGEQRRADAHARVRARGRCRGWCGREDQRGPLPLRASGARARAYASPSGSGEACVVEDADVVEAAGELLRRARRRLRRATRRPRDRLRRPGRARRPAAPRPCRRVPLPRARRCTRMRWP